MAVVVLAAVADPVALLAAAVLVAAAVVLHDLVK